MRTGNQKRRVLLDARLHASGGIGTYIRGMCANIDSIWDPEQHDIHILCTSTGTESCIRHVQKSNVHICDAVPFSVSEQFALHKHIKNIQPDLFFSPHVNTPLLSVLHGFYKKITFIACVHDTFMFGEEITTSQKSHGNIIERIVYTCKKRILRILFSLYTRHANICSVSETSAASIRTVFGCPVRVLYPILPVVPYVSRDKDIDTLCIGHAGPHKRIRWAIEHMRISNKAWIGGIEGEKRAVVYSNISDFKKNELISRTKTLVFPSIAEGFGLPPLEALRMGVSVVISDIPVHREIYGSGPGVYFFTVDDADDLNARIQEAISVRDAVGISTYWRQKFIEKDLVDEYRTYMC